MAATVPRGTHSAKWCISVEEVNCYVVHEERARACLILEPHQVRVSPGILSEIVDGERLIKLLNELNCFLDILVGENGEDGAKDFLFHQIRFE